jgi:phosphoribosyl-AMP cyclohydrolase
MKENTSELLLDFGLDGKSLIPVVTQDVTTKDVLILAYVNKEAFEESLISGYATFFSRSRNAIWKKGSTSGDFLRIEEIRVNCEQNSLLFLVTPEGRGVCHAKDTEGLPHKSCFYRKLVEGKLEIIK